MGVGRDQEGKEGGSHLFLTTLSLSRVPGARWRAPICIWGGLELEGRQTGITLNCLFSSHPPSTECSSYLPIDTHLGLPTLLLQAFLSPAILLTLQ